MAILSTPSFGPRTALIYVTVGTLLDVWTAVWYFTISRPAGSEESHTTWFWLAGLFLTGLTLIVIGLLLGPIGRAARKSELPPVSATIAEANIQQTAAANPQAIVTNGVAPQMAAQPAMAPVMLPSAVEATPRRIVVGS